MPRLLMLLIGLGFITAAAIKRPMSKQQKLEREVERLRTVVKLRKKMEESASEALTHAEEQLQDAEAALTEAKAKV